MLCAVHLQPTVMPIIRERKVLIDVIEKYRDEPVLWDQKHDMYGSKKERKKGYDQLLEIYRTVDPDATSNELKRKIDNLRSSYRRERVKVLNLQRKGKQYVPTLWYYPLFTFLPDRPNCPNPDRPPQCNVQAEGKEEEEDEEEEEVEDVEEEEDEVEDREEVANTCLKSEYTSDSPPPIKKKKTNQICTNDDLSDMLSDTDSYLISTVNNQCNQTTEEKSSSTESFAKTIGLQLNELEPVQKCIAEKLISDVIYYGRLGKLQSETNIYINNED